MKLTHISLAVLTAIALTACGGDNDSTGNSAGANDAQVKAAQAAQKKAEQEAAKAKAEAEKLKKEAGGLVDSYADTHVEHTDEKGLDTIAETVKGDKWTDKTSVSGQQYIRNKDSSFADDQNPLKDGKNASATALTSLTVTDLGLGNFVAAQQEGVIPGTNKKTQVLSYFGQYLNDLSNGGNAFPPIQETNKMYVLVNTGTAATNFENATDSETNGLVAINRFAQGQILGTEEKNNAATRFFGNFYKEYNVNQPTNTYVGAEQSATKSADGNYHLVAIPGFLDDVQYGRVTGNLEIDAGDGKHLVNDRVVEHFNFAKHFDPKGVSIYFYRGTNETTLDEMKKLSGVLNYTGHALTYGVLHGYKGNGNSFPTAFANGWGEGLGSFVKATYDVKKQVVSGNIYDVFVKDNSKKSDLLEDSLIEFSGKVFGNTAKGHSTLLAAHSKTGQDQKGDFKGSFYGSKAGELGGAVNSITSSEGYGKSGSAWGAVFGAKAVQKETPVTTPKGSINWLTEDQ